MKKTLLLLMFVASAMNIWSKNVKFTISGIAPAGATEIIVQNLNMKKLLGKVKVVDGQFSYSGTLPDDTYLYFYDPRSRAYNYVITDGAQISLDMQKDQCVGTPLNERLYATAHAIGQKLQAYDQSNAEVKRASAADTLAMLQAKRDEKLQDVLAYIRKTVEENNDNCVPAYVVTMNCEIIPFDELIAYRRSGAAYVKHPFFKNALQYMERQAENLALIGHPYKDANLKTGRGTTAKLSEYIGHGNYVLVDFWASWCKPCMGEMPFVTQAYAAYHGKGFEIVGISLDKDRTAWIGAVSNLGLSWPQFCDLSGFQGAAAVKYNVHAIPWNFLCDGDGKIVAVNLRGEKLLEKLSEIYGN